MDTPTPATVRLGGRSFAIAPLRLGRMKRLRRELMLVLQAKDMSPTDLPDETVVDAYAALVTASIGAADPSLAPTELSAWIDDLEYFEGAADLAIAAVHVLRLSNGEPSEGEAAGPPASEASTSMPSTSTGSTD
jgi:hypothetical protein